jgi:hypothetical protein
LHRLYGTPDDFEAKIRIFSREEGGRSKPPYNGIRWDFCYFEDLAADNLWMIWPDFFVERGDSLAINEPLPIGNELSARMTILVDEMRAEVHRKRLHVGAQFYCHEGPRRVAIGYVTRITGLFDERSASQRTL